MWVWQGKNYKALMDWIGETDPAEFDRLSRMPQLSVLERLNELSGLNIQPNDRIEGSCETFLRVLKAKRSL